MPFVPAPGTHSESSTLSKTLTEVGWTGVYVGLVVAAASLAFAQGVPVQGCYPGCIGGVEPTLAIAGVAALVVGVVAAAAGNLVARRE
jgi:hypothetical protein